MAFALGGVGGGGGLEDFTWGIVEEEIETIALLTIRRSASISSMEE